MSKIVDIIKKTFRINHTVIKDEVNEIKNLDITDEDKAQGKAAAVLVASAMAACGVPMGALGQPVLEKVLPYVIRDAKDGISTPDKLIIKRIVNEVKKEKEQGTLKTPEEKLLDSMNKPIS